MQWGEDKVQRWSSSFACLTNLDDEKWRVCGWVWVRPIPRRTVRTLQSDNFLRAGYAALSSSGNYPARLASENKSFESACEIWLLAQLLRLQLSMPHRIARPSFDPRRLETRRLNCARYMYALIRSVSVTGPDVRKTRIRRAQC